MQPCPLPMVRAYGSMELGGPSHSGRKRTRSEEGVESRQAKAIRSYKPFEREIRDAKECLNRAIKMLEKYKRMALELAQELGEVEDIGTHNYFEEEIQEWARCAHLTNEKLKIYYMCERETTTRRQAGDTRCLVTVTRETLKRIKREVGELGNSVNQS